mmetsp:Transcript_19148/g.51472  ORF Transcript_19148/g.51472 Transcript_19148/m.51472 type:complete len:207 (+) Transcript_19148:748-1368(+)
MLAPYLYWWFMVVRSHIREPTCRVMAIAPARPAPRARSRLCCNASPNTERAASTSLGGGGSAGPGLPSSLTIRPCILCASTWSQRLVASASSERSDRNSSSLAASAPAFSSGPAVRSGSRLLDGNTTPPCNLGDCEVWPSRKELPHSSYFLGAACCSVTSAESSSTMNRLKPPSEYCTFNMESDLRTSTILTPKELPAHHRPVPAM